MATAVAGPPADARAATKTRPPSIARVGNPPSALAPGAKFNLRYRVVNRSRKRSGRAVLSARLAPAAGRRIMLRGHSSMPALRGRRTVRGKRRMTAPAGLKPGTYRLIACLKRRGVKARCRAASRRIEVAGGDGRAAVAPGPAPSTAPDSSAPEAPPPAPESTTPAPDAAAPAPDAAAPAPTNPPPPPAPSPPPTLVAAGDIAGCEDWSVGDSQTAALLDDLDADVVAPLGDLVYEYGTLREFNDCYEPTWGRHKPTTRPAVGNHEYATSGASGYFTYFGAAAGNPAEGYYAYDLGSWRIIALNSNCSRVACDGASAQAQWLRRELADHPTACTLAYWHHPLFNSAPSTGERTAMVPLWDILDDAGADVLLTGHAHTYERFAPQTSAGIATADGLRQFIVGTGGRSHHSLGSEPASNSELSHTGTFGVVEMTLKPGSYDWRFVPVTGGSFSDQGTASCV